jgi:hypothetical protein
MDLCEGVVCDDGNFCTSDTCDTALACVFASNTLPCNDANACAQDDRCAAGICSGTPLLCDDQSSCTADVCDPLFGCTYNNLCHIYATCVAAACECMTGYEGDGYDCSPTPPACGNGSCTDSENHLNCPADCEHDLLVIVENDLAQILGPSLNTSLRDLEGEGFRGRIEPWTPGTVDELRSLTYAYVDELGVDGVLLIGNMPTAWYEQTAFDVPEEFTMDLFLEDRDAVWADGDADGVYDSHSDLELDIYVSRLQTLPHAEACSTSASFPTCPPVYDPGGELYASEACIDRCPSGFIAQSREPNHPDVECCGTFFLKRYFARLHDYRTHGSSVEQSAVIFADDNWAIFVEAQRPFGLDATYSTIDVITYIEDSTNEKYIEMSIGGGSEFVYHWMHSSPNNLYIYHDDVAHQIHRTQIGWSPYLPATMTYNLEVAFMNMFSCEAARFTVLNIATAMVFQTDFALAIGAPRSVMAFTTRRSSTPISHMKRRGERPFASGTITLATPSMSGVSEWFSWVIRC